MPSRVSARASSTTSTRKSSVPPSNAGPAVFVPEEPAPPTSSPNLRPNIVEVFADAQGATTGHRKLVVKLRKLQEYCCGLRAPEESGKNGKKGRKSLGGLGFDDREGVAEKEFNAEISRCLLRVLGIKKAEGAGDRVVKFLGTFLKTATEKGRLRFFSMVEYLPTMSLNVLGYLTETMPQILRRTPREMQIRRKRCRKRRLPG